MLMWLAQYCEILDVSSILIHKHKYLKKYNRIDSFKLNIKTLVSVSLFEQFANRLSTSHVYMAAFFFYRAGALSSEIFIFRITTPLKLHNLDNVTIHRVVDKNISATILHPGWWVFCWAWSHLIISRFFIVYTSR